MRSETLRQFSTSVVCVAGKQTSEHHACAMGRHMNERQTAIIELVSERGRVSVTELAEKLHISEVTIRKDLKLLSEKGILNKEQGYASLKSADDLNYRMAFHYETKNRIAVKAAELVKNGETILVESGSTCALFAQALVKSGKNVTLITNSTHLAHFAADKGNVNLVLLGGEYQKAGQAMVGPLTKICAKEFSVDKIFVGTDGFSQELGFTGDDMTRAETVRAMAGSARHIYVLTESDKFKHSGTVSFLKPEEVYMVITDEKLSQEKKEYLQQQGIQVLQA